MNHQPAKHQFKFDIWRFALSKKAQQKNWEKKHMRSDRFHSTGLLLGILVIAYLQMSSLIPYITELTRVFITAHNRQIFILPFSVVESLRSKTCRSSRGCDRSRKKGSIDISEFTSLKNIMAFILHKQTLLYVEVSDM